MATQNTRRRATTTTTVRGIPFLSGGAAVQHAEAAGGDAIMVGGRHLVVPAGEADRLAAAGVALAHLADHEWPDGRRQVPAVPVN